MLWRIQSTRIFLTGILSSINLRNSRPLLLVDSAFPNSPPSHFIQLLTYRIESINFLSKFSGSRLLLQRRHHALILDSELIYQRWAMDFFVMKLFSQFQSCQSSRNLSRQVLRRQVSSHRYLDQRHGSIKASQNVFENGWLKDGESESFKDEKTYRVSGDFSAGDACLNRLNSQN